MGGKKKNKKPYICKMNWYQTTTAVAEVVYVQSSTYPISDERNP